MLLRSWLLVAFAVVGFLFAPNARAADTTYVTFSAGGVTSPRLVAAALTTVAPTDVSPKKPGTAHIEIDDWTGAAAILSVADKGVMSVKVEYAGAADQVNLVLTFQHAFVQSWKGNFNVASAAAPTGQVIDLLFVEEQMSAPAGSKSVVPKDAPRVTRLAPRTPTLRFDDAYVKADGITGASAAPHAGQIHATSAIVAIDWPLVISHVGVTVEIIARPPTVHLEITKAIDSATVALANAKSNRTNLAHCSVQFDQHGSTDLVRYAIDLSAAQVSAESTTATSTAQTESDTFTSSMVRVSDATTNLAVAVP